MKKVLYGLIFTLIVLCKTSFSQTNVSGGIYSNTTWTLSNSPYIVVDTVIVFPSVELTIEPGVVVKFNPNKVLEIRQSSLTAIGTSLDSIIFTSNAASPAMNDYGGIQLNNCNRVRFNYCGFYYANRALTGGSNDTVSVNNSTFQFNGCGYFNFSSSFYANACNFRNNSTAIDGANGGYYNNCVITKNNIGINGNGYIVLKNSVIDSNSVMGVETNASDSIYNNDIKYNGTGLKLQFGGGGNTIVAFQNQIEFNSIGVEMTNSPGYIFNIYCNKICNNTAFDAKNSGTSNYNILENNYWCVNDSAIISSHIFDGYDDPSFGLMDFIPFDTTSCYISGCNILITPSVTNATCDTCPNGSASVQTAHSFPPYIYTWNTSPIQSGQTANHLSSGNYTVCVTDAHGCTACSSVFVDSTNCSGYSIHAIPVSSTCSTCSDGIAYAVITGGTAPYSYTWYSSPVQNTDTATGLTAGLYTVCVSDLYGCLDCDTFTVTTGNCSAHFNLYPDTIPHNYFAVNMASGNGQLSYSWNWGDGTPNDTGAYPSHLYASAGLYSICLTITDSVGCTNTYCNSYYLLRQGESNTIVSVSVVPALATSINEKPMLNQVSIYPNPTTSSFILRNIPPVINAKIRVVNPLGLVIYEKENVRANEQINISLSPAIYFVIIDSQNYSKILRLMIY